MDRGDFRRYHARICFGSPSIPLRQRSQERPCAWGMVLVQKKPLQYRFENSSRLYPAWVPLSRFVAVETRILEKCARTLESPLAVIPEGETPQPQPLVGAE